MRTHDWLSLCTDATATDTVRRCTHGSACGDVPGSAPRLTLASHITPPLSPQIATSPVAGDVDGDGALEVLLAGSDGRVHVLRGATGEEAPGFPFQTAGQIMAPLSLVRAPGECAGEVGDTARGDGLLVEDMSGKRTVNGGACLPCDARCLVSHAPPHFSAYRRSVSHVSCSTLSPPSVWKRSLIAAASFDGHLYLIDSAEACADRAEVGEVSYAMPLVEDLGEQR